MPTRERRERSNSADAQLTALFLAAAAATNPAINLTKSKIAIAGIGGYGRGELTPGSDLDIAIVHDGSLPAELLSDFVNKFLYPLWDGARKIDHSVRTRAETRKAAEEDIKVAMALLDIRHIAGDLDMIADLHQQSYGEWEKNKKKNVPKIRTVITERSVRSGELAYLLEPDLKEARGGLRDASALRAIAALKIVPVALERISEAESILQHVREVLHEVSGKDRDQLLFQEQDKVANKIGYINADALMADVAKSARAIDYLMDLTWHRIDQYRAHKIFRKKKPVLLGNGLAIDGGEVVITRYSDIALDAGLGWRAGATAAQMGIPLSIDTCVALAENFTELPPIWPKSVREDLITLLGAGVGMVKVWEGLDQEGLIAQWIPQWRHLRSLPQRNALHRHTVDRHCVETVVHAAALTRRVHRPDLLLVAALFHDIGKGFPSKDHSDYGAQIIAPLAVMLGFSADESEVLSILVKHHLLLSSIATRRDLQDPVTIESVISQIPNPETLELLHALSIADGEATGRSAWSSWKATLVDNLVAKCLYQMTGSKGIAPAPQLELSAEQIKKAESGALTVEITAKDAEYEIEIIVPDRQGLLALIAGTLSIARFDLRSARTRSYGKSAVMTWSVELDEHINPPSNEKLRSALDAALNGDVDIAAKLAERVKNKKALPAIPVPPPLVNVIEGGATDATIIEIRMHDRPGLLYAIANEVTRANVDIRAAIVSTLGAEAFDTLYITDSNGVPLESKVAWALARELESTLY